MPVHGTYASIYFWNKEWIFPAEINDAFTRSIINSVTCFGKVWWFLFLKLGWRQISNKAKNMLSETSSICGNLFLIFSRWRNKATTSTCSVRELITLQRIELTSDEIVFWMYGCFSEVRVSCAQIKMCINISQSVQCMHTLMLSHLLAAFAVFHKAIPCLAPVNQFFLQVWDLQ